jgi:hypothetical protein
MKHLDNLALDMAEVAVRDGIPLVWSTAYQVEAVVYGDNRSIKGFCIHAQINPATRYDPSTEYPYDLLTERIGQYMGADGVHPNAAGYAKLAGATTRPVASSPGAYVY